MSTSRRPPRDTGTQLAFTSSQAALYLGVSLATVRRWSDAGRGQPHGYFDGWRADRCFHYTGEGQRGDQTMKSGNAAILNHVAKGRSLRVFMGARGIVTYEDEFELDAEQPWYTTEAPETGGGPVRNVIVFRMRPTTIDPKPLTTDLDALLDRQVEDVPIESQWTEKAFVEPSRAPYEAERREQKLVIALRDHLRARHHEVVRLKIVPPGEAKPLFSDLLDRTTGTLVEAKGSAERGAIRMAIGQLADYKRFATPAPKTLAVLLPSPPRADLRELLASENIQVIWPTSNGFDDTMEGALIQRNERRVALRMFAAVREQIGAHQFDRRGREWNDLGGRHLPLHRLPEHRPRARQRPKFARRRD